MKGLKIALLVVLIVSLGTGIAMATGASVKKGMALFNDTKLGTAGNSCNTCHPDGKGLEGAGAKKEWKTPAGERKTLEDAVNTCITMALKGKALDVKSDKMKSMVMYIKSLGSMKKPAAKKRKPVAGC
jgi:cytochrome c